MLVRDAVARFLAGVEAEHSAATHRTYTQRLSRLTPLLGDREIASLTEDDLLDYLDQAGRHPDRRLMSSSTRRSNIIVLLQLQRHALKRKWIDKAVINEIKKPPDRQRDRIPTRHEQAQLLWAARRNRSFRRIYQALRLCGARPNELAAATIEQYDQARGLIVLVQHKTARKTGQTRKIGVGKRLARILTKAIGSRSDGPIFLNTRGKQWSPQSLSHTYRRLRAKLGQSKELCLYAATRHEHGTLVTQKHGIYAAAHSLGHKDIKTTQRYAHPRDELLGRYQDEL